jgi:hypothetical protein
MTAGELSEANINRSLFFRARVQQFHYWMGRITA